MGLLDSCDQYFGTKNLYELLKIEKTATDSEVKKAYRSLSLLVHPDRVVEEEKEQATEKFKVLGKVHAILSDEKKRELYDESGLINDGDDCDFDERDWSEYWRCIFNEITMDDIISYEKKYKGSEDELNDLKKAYRNGKGCVDFIFNHVPFIVLGDEPRIREIIGKLIEEGELEPFDQFLKEDPKKTQRRKRKLEREAKEAEQLENEINEKKQKKSARNSKNKENGNEEDLMVAIMQKKRERESLADGFFDHLLSKYGNEEKKKTPRGKKGKK